MKRDVFRSSVRWTVWVALALSLGCGASGGAKSTAPTVQPSADVDARHAKLVAAGDASWQERAQRAKLKDSISQWEAARYLKPADWQVALKLGRAYELLGQWLRVDKDRDAALAAFEAGMKHCDEGLRAQSGSYDKRRRLGVDVHVAVELIDREGIGLVYWYTSNWAVWMRIKGSKAAFALRKKIVAMASHVYDVDADYFYRGADRFFGTYYALLPSELGGDLKKSAKHFRDAIKKAPQHLETSLLMADVALRRAPPFAGIDELIARVIDAQPCGPDESSGFCVPEDLSAEHELYKTRATYLRAKLRRKLKK